MNTERAITVRDENRFEFSPALQQLAENIAKSTIIPREFQGNPANCLIALELAHRISAGILATMQSMYIVHGKPSWSGQFIIGCVNNTRRFSPLRFHFNEAKDECYAFAQDSEGNELIGPTASVAMAKAEGWYQNNKKWQTMTQLMLMYRSGTFFGRVFCPDVLLGMREQYEVIEAEAVEIKQPQIETHTKDMVADAGVGASQAETETAPAAAQQTPPPDAAPQSPPPKKTVKKKLQVKPEAPPPKTEAPLIETKVGPNRLLLQQRLSVGGYNEIQFLELANYQGWLGRNKTWATMDQVPDEMFEVFLQPEEWPTVQKQLEAMPRHTKD